MNVSGPHLERLEATSAERAQRTLAGGLLARGLVAGDRVLVAPSNGVDLLLVALAALRVGIVPVVLHGGLLDHERAVLHADADPALVVDDRVVAELRDAAPVEVAPWPLARPMHYTSGTTGQPKGVHTGVLDDAEAALAFTNEADLWGFDEHDVHLVCSPFHHSVAIRFAGHTLLRGGTVLVPGPFDARLVHAVFAAEAPTTTFMAPAHLQRLFAAGEPRVPASLRLLAHAGSPCPEPLKRQAIDVFGVGVVHEFYGSTEGQFTVCSAGEWLERPGTVGRARPDRHVWIGDDDRIWCDVGAESRFSYWRSPERTAQAWREPNRRILPDGRNACGAFSVGDLGHLDTEGYLFIDGRRDDLIISGGVNIYPVEVEAALAALDGVDEVAVFGIDDERWGARVCAAFVGSAEPEQIRNAARSLLAAHKCPKLVVRVEELPHTATGKLPRARLAELLDVG